jgi:MEDS: MEthanogen/methylotroph, DcmR Sensory domain
MSAAENTQVPAGPLGHIVQFYADDAELADRVASYLADGLRRGAAGIMLATPEHRQAIFRHLVAQGFDPAPSRQQDLTVLDAGAVLDRFLIGGRVDPADFEQQVGGLVRHAAGTGRPVRIYGEMVALLWASGQVSAAVELEILWNELRAFVPFSLLCGYPAEYFSGDQHADALEEMCGLHSGVTGAASLGGAGS